jgi:hypothetical protein
MTAALNYTISLRRDSDNATQLYFGAASAGMYGLGWMLRTAPERPRAIAATSLARVSARIGRVS